MSTSAPSPPPPPPKRWASLADRLNPNRPSFDPQLKSSWKTMPNPNENASSPQIAKAIQILKSRGTANGPLPFPDVDPNDHCETSPLAYTHIAPLLHFIAQRLGKQKEELEIYDPYYCAGGMVRHLSKLGYTNVYNKCEDFYEVIDKGKVPSHDVLLTNPPYSGDHFDKLLGFLSGNNKPALLLLPEHFSNNKSSLYSPDKFCFLSPPERYHYWTPDGMRPEPEQQQQQQQPDEKKKKKRKKQHRNLVLGSRNSPFASHWFICMDPIVTNDTFVSLVNNNDGGEITLVEGCRIHNKQESILPTKFKGLIQNNGEEDNGAKKKKKRRRRNKKKTADFIEEESS